MTVMAFFRPLGCCLFALAAVFADSHFHGFAVAQSPALQPPETASGKVLEPGVPDPVEQRRRQRAYSGLLALTGILVAGLGLIGVTLLWGRRLRRINRQPLPSADLKNEFWFLRTPERRGDERPDESG